MHLYHKYHFIITKNSHFHLHKITRGAVLILKFNLLSLGLLLNRQCREIHRIMQVFTSSPLSASALCEEPDILCNCLRAEKANTIYKLLK